MTAWTALDLHSDSDCKLKYPVGQAPPLSAQMQQAQCIRMKVLCIYPERIVRQIVLNIKHSLSFA